eukprot:7664864-Lingulodinium_polyedra.AAC.1
MVGKGAHTYISSLRAELQVPWGPHCGLVLSLNIAAERVANRVLTGPGPLKAVEAVGASSACSWEEAT